MRSYENKIVKTNKNYYKTNYFPTIESLNDVNLLFKTGFLFEIYKDSKINKSLNIK